MCVAFCDLSVIFYTFENRIITAKSSIGRRKIELIKLRKTTNCHIVRASKLTADHIFIYEFTSKTRAIKGTKWWGKILILIDEYMPLGDTYSLRRDVKISKFVTLTYKNTTHTFFSLFLLLAKKYFRTFDVICIVFLRCANEECECSTWMRKWHFEWLNSLLIWYISIFEILKT